MCVVENPKNYIRKYNENKDVTDYTNEIEKLHSLNIKLKHDSDKPPDYYQYNMKNKTMTDFRLDAYQTENNVKSNMSILKEENDSDKTINELKTDEDDFQTNLNLILNEYKNKQNYYNTTKTKIDDNELQLETDDINRKLDELTTDNKKLPVIYKTLTQPIFKDEKINKKIKAIFDNNKTLNDQKDILENKKNNMNEKQIKIFEIFTKIFFDNIKTTDGNIEKLLINLIDESNNFVDNNMFIKEEKKKVEKKKVEKKERLYISAKNNDLLKMLPQPPPLLKKNDSLTIPKPPLKQDDLFNVQIEQGDLLDQEQLKDDLLYEKQKKDDEDFITTLPTALLQFKDIFMITRQLERELVGEKNKSKKINQIQRVLLNIELVKANLNPIRKNNTRISAILNKINVKITEKEKIII